MHTLPEDLPADGAGAVHAVYAALEDLQAHEDHANVRARLDRWAGQARERPDVLAQVLHCHVLNDLLDGAPPDRLRARHDAFVAAAEASGDEVLVARALGGRIIYLGPSAPGSVEDRWGDLARSVATLDDVAAEPGLDGLRAAGLGAAYVECGQAYHCLDLWELEAEMYDRAVASLALVREPALVPVLGFTRRVVVVNRVEAAAAMACALLEAGHAEQAAQVAASRYRPDADEIAGLPRLWSTELRAVERLLDAVASGPAGADDLHGVPAALWDDLDGSTWSGYRGCLLLAAAVAAHHAGDRVRAAGFAERAIGHLDEYKPSFVTLAHRLAVATADVAALRLADRLTTLRHDGRLGILAAARARLTAERVVRNGERLRRQAHVDELTGVANRHVLAERLEVLRAASPGRGLAVVVVDVDDFKAVNDSFGHGVGDEVLRVIGGLLRGAVRATDVAARLGGDEFVLLLHLDGPPAPLVRRVSDVVTQVRSQDWARLAPGLHVTVSIGAATGEAADVDALLRAADENVYRAKAQGRDRLVS